MKNDITYKITLVIFSAFILTQCTICKRHYRRGYQVVKGSFMQTTIRCIIIAFFIGFSCVKGQVTLLNNSYSSGNDGSLYWTGTIVFSAINLTTTYFNIKKMHKHDKYRSNAFFGALFGAAQTALGFASLNAKYNNAYIPTSINIGIGLTTLVTSVVRLATKNPSKENNVTLNFICFPNDRGKSSMFGLAFKKQF